MDFMLVLGFEWKGHQERNGNRTGFFTVQSVFGEPGGRKVSKAEFSDDFVFPIMKQVAEMNWMKTPGTIILDRFGF